MRVGISGSGLMGGKLWYDLCAGRFFGSEGAQNRYEGMLIPLLYFSATQAFPRDFRWSFEG